MRTLRILGQYLEALWATGNRWLRWLVGFIVVWPVLMILSALTGNGPLTSMVSLLPLAAIIVIVLTWPLITAIIASTRAGERALGYLILILAAELTFGVVVSIVPISNDRWLVPLFLLVISSLILLSAAGFGRKRWAVRLLALVLMAITVIFFLGGRKEAEKKVRTITQGSTPPAVSVRSANHTKTQGSVQIFQCSANELISSVELIKGSRYVLDSNYKYYTLSHDRVGTPRPAGRISRRAYKSGRLDIECRHDGTILKISEER